MFLDAPRSEGLTCYTARAQVCILCVWVCLVNWGPASWSCHPFASVFCSYMKGKQLVLSSFSPFFHRSFPRSTEQSWAINRNKLSALQAEPPLHKEAQGEGEARERKTEWRRDGAGQVELCKQELIWQLEAAHVANHQHKFEMGDWNLLLCKTCRYHKKDSFSVSARIKVSICIHTNKQRRQIAGIGQI